jgi:hypothetical protein
MNYRSDQTAARRSSRERPVRRAVRLLAGFLPLLVVVFLFSCDDCPTCPTPVPATIVIVSGDAQSGIVGQLLPAQLVVLVTDEDGHPVAGTTVTWQVTQGGGSVAAEGEDTDAAGRALARWTLGTTLGDQAAIARLAAGQRVTFAASAGAGPAHKLEVHAGDQQRALAGTQLADSAVVMVTDAYSNPVAGTVVDWIITGGDGSVSPERSTTDAQGLASTSWTLGGVAGPNVISASIPGPDAVAFYATADAMSSQYVSGTVVLPEDATISPMDLKVVSIADAASVQDDGAFSVRVAQSESYQILFISDESTEQPVMIGLVDPVTGSALASDSSTALALTLVNPYLTGTTQAQRGEYLAAVEAQPGFSDLVTMLRQAYRSDAAQALDWETNPRVYQLVVEVMRGAMDQLGGATGLSLDRGAAAAGLSPPYIRDIPADVRIELVNPRHIYYGAGIYENGSDLREAEIVNRSETVLSFQFGWPPVTTTDPKITEYDLGDGYFGVYLVKGFDFSKIGDLTDPIGRATLWNTRQGIIYFLDILIGFVPLPDFTDLPSHLHLDGNLAASMGLHAAQLDVERFLIDFAQLVNDNREEIAYWVWGEFQTNAAAHVFISTAAGILGRVALVLEILGYVNEEGPFYWDLIFAPREITYYVTQEGGTIVSMDQNDPPLPEFTVSPPAGIVRTEFQFDASATSDDHDGAGAISLRWDWESDGAWDTDWQVNPLATHTYSGSSAYTVSLEAMDSQGLAAIKTHLVVVGGGAGTATHVKLFRANLPWSSQAQEQVLQSVGLVEGTGPGTYEIVGLGEMATAPLTPGEDLVIISNDQSQAFYDTYASYQVRFTNFVHAGGSVLWEACDEGWAYGSMADAGVVLPGSISATLDVDSWNYVSNPTLPLMSGLPEAMDHNYASHRSFSNLPDGAVIYMVNESGDPTLIEYNLGQGWVILTGQPLEHQYDHVYGNPDMESLLPRIVAYFTGTEAGAAAALAAATSVADRAQEATRRTYRPLR